MKMTVTVYINGQNVGKVTLSRTGSTFLWPFRWQPDLKRRSDTGIEYFFYLK